MACIFETHANAGTLLPPTSPLHVNAQKKGCKEREAMIAGTVEFGALNLDMCKLKSLHREVGDLMSATTTNPMLLPVLGIVDRGDEAEPVQSLVFPQIARLSTYV
jgi:hypothetical protein